MKSWNARTPCTWLFQSYQLKMTINQSKLSLKSQITLQSSFFCKETLRNDLNSNLQTAASPVKQLWIWHFDQNKKKTGTKVKKISWNNLQKSGILACLVKSNNTQLIPANWSLRSTQLLLSTWKYILIEIKVVQSYSIIF